MKKLCYFKWYPADAMGDSDWATMNHAERGFYMQCLNFAWLNSGIPSDPGERAKLLSTRQTLADKLWVRVSKKFVASPSTPGLLVNSRQEIDRQEVIEKSQQCAEAGSKTKRKREQTSSYGSRSGAQMETSTEVQNAQVPIESENVENGRSRFVKPRALARADSESDSVYDLKSKPETKTVSRAEEPFPPPPRIGDRTAEEWAERWYARHPKKRNRSLVEQVVVRLVMNPDKAIGRASVKTAAELFALIDRAHEILSATHDWTKDGARYCPKLDEWLTDEGYRAVEVAPKKRTSEIDPATASYDKAKAEYEAAIASGEMTAEWDLKEFYAELGK